MNREVRNALHRARHDAGFTLVEVTVAVFVAALLLTSLTLMLGNSVRSVRDKRAQEQATVIALEQIEIARSVAWEELALDDPVSPLDPRLVSPFERKLVGAAVSLPGDETLVEHGSGLITYRHTETFDGQPFEVFNYVTEVQPGLRRAVSIVEWEIGPKSHLHFTSTLISSVSAG